MLIHPIKLVVRTFLKSTARQPFKAYTTSTFNAFSQIFFLLCSKTIIAAILIHQNAIDLNLTQQYRNFYICLLCLFRLADFIFAYFIASTSSTENNSILKQQYSRENLGHKNYPPTKAHSISCGI